MKLVTITPQFVELIPREIQDGVLYISEEYRTASHMCCCGCGMKVVTSLSPARWQLYREGNLVTLHPSIGNWDFPCRSHYWIRKNRVVWSGAMSQQKIQRVKERDKRDIGRYIEQSNVRKIDSTLMRPKANRVEEQPVVGAESKTLWQWLITWWKN